MKDTKGTSEPAGGKSLATCPTCARPLPANAPAGLCPSCLLAYGDSTVADSHEPRSRFEPPPISVLAALFPQLEILRLIGAGGMGAVYQARQTALGRYVALKILPAGPVGSGGAAASSERFNREARALARLSHPNIVAVHEFGQAGNLHYFLMEYVDGANLRQLQRAGRLSPREALQVVPQLCDALQYAHDEGVVHRDIKPENVLVDRKGRVKVADFGLAKLLDPDPGSSRLTLEGQVMGTPHYMAPEQVERPLSVDHRADIYSLGVVFYEMLTGELPLGKFAPPSRKPGVDVRLDDILFRALENDPACRYQHASEVKQGVETLGSPLPSSAATAAAISAPPPAPNVRQLRWLGIPVVVERDGEREVSFQGALGAVFATMAVATVAHLFVRWLTGGEHALPNLSLGAGLFTVFWGIRRTLRREDSVPGANRRFPYALDALMLVLLVAVIIAGHFVKVRWVNTRPTPPNEAKTPVKAAPGLPDSPADSAATKTPTPLEPPPVPPRMPSNEPAVYVEGGDRYPTIQAALDAAPPGGTVYVSKGRYAETLLVQKPVRVLGAGWQQTVIDPGKPLGRPPPEEARALQARFQAAQTNEEREALRREAEERYEPPVLRVRAEGGGEVVLSGLRFTRPGAAPDGALLTYTAVDVAAGRVRMEICAVVGSPGNGIIVRGGAEARLNGCLAAAVWNVGAAVQPGGSLLLFNSDIRNCYYTGITAGSGALLNVQHCRISGSAWHGIRYDATQSPLILSNAIFSNARSGIYASGKTRATVWGNVFAGNEMNGMSCWYENRDEVVGNTFVRNQREALAILGASNPTIASNVFQQNPVAVFHGAIANQPPPAPLPVAGFAKNWFWGNTKDFTGPVDGNGGAANPLAEAGARSVFQDPSLVDPEKGLYAETKESAARAAHAGAADPFPIESPFELQPEEIAMIPPKGASRDSRAWKR